MAARVLFVLVVIEIDINNQTDTPEQLHWHGQFLERRCGLSMLWAEVQPA